MSSASYTPGHILLDIALIPISNIDYVATDGKIMHIYFKTDGRPNQLRTSITYSSLEEVELNLLRIHAFIRLHEADKVIDNMMRDDDKISHIKDVILTKQQIQSSLNVLNDHGSDKVMDYQQIQRMIYNATDAIHHLQVKYIDDNAPPSNLTTFVEGVGILALDEIQSVYIIDQVVLRIFFTEGTESYRSHNKSISIQYSDAQEAQHALIRLNNAMDEDQEEEEEVKHDQIEEDLKRILNLLNDLTKEQQQEVYSHIYEDINKQRQEKQLEPIICTEYKKQEEDKGSKTTADDLEKILAACKASAAVQNATREDIDKALALIKAATIRVGAFHRLKKQDQDSKTTDDLENILADVKASAIIQNATTDALRQLLTHLDDLTEEEQQTVVSRFCTKVAEHKKLQDGFMSNLESVFAEQKKREEEEEKDWTPKAMRAREDALIDGMSTEQKNHLAAMEIAAAVQQQAREQKEDRIIEMMHQHNRIRIQEEEEKKE